MKYIILTLSLFISVMAVAQSTDTAKKYHYVQQMPRVGFDLQQYLSKNVHYPKSAIDNNIEGRVVVQFVVNEDGSIGDCEVIRSLNKECDAEALRVIKNMTKWTPGKQDGKPVKVVFTQPVSFKLQGKSKPEEKKIESAGPVIADQDKVYTYVQQMPEFKGELNKYFAENIHYPKAAADAGITGRVVVQFVVKADGTIDNVKVLRGIGAGCDEEALRVIKNMPPWKPGKQEGKPVNVMYTTPVTFMLR